VKLNASPVTYRHLCTSTGVHTMPKINEIVLTLILREEDSLGAVWMKTMLASEGGSFPMHDHFEGKFYVTGPTEQVPSCFYLKACTNLVTETLYALSA
jgi:hypothetical protein